MFKSKSFLYTPIHSHVFTNAVQPRPSEDFLPLENHSQQVVIYTIVEPELMLSGWVAQ